MLPRRAFRLPPLRMTGGTAPSGVPALAAQDDRGQCPVGALRTELKLCPYRNTVSLPPGQGAWRRGGFRTRPYVR